MTKNDIIKYSIFGVLGIAVIILLISLFTSYRDRGNDYYKDLIKAKDETIKAIQEQRDIYKEVNERTNQILVEHEKKDSILYQQSKQLVIRYEKIPVYINSLDRDGLRAAFSNY